MNLLQTIAFQHCFLCSSTLREIWIYDRMEWTSVLWTIIFVLLQYNDWNGIYTHTRSTHGQCAVVAYHTTVSIAYRSGYKCISFWLNNIYMCSWMCTEYAVCVCRVWYERRMSAYNVFMCATCTYAKECLTFSSVSVQTIIINRCMHD